MIFDRLYEMKADAQTRWTSFENPTGEKGKGGVENKKAKGRPSMPINPGESIVLLDVAGSGIINRIWMTLSDRSEKMLRAIKLEIFWDGCEKPAVSTPIGDFFCAGLGILSVFENYLFSSPEGKSFNCFVPMPFLHGARVVITNESDIRLNHVFYDINYTLTPLDTASVLYFHAYWNRENTTQLGKDYTILDLKNGKGKLVGLNLGVNAGKGYGNTWFGEGEVKVYLDGDTEYPTLCGTGTEDYIGTGWGQGRYTNMTQGCPVADGDKKRFTFYRLHIHDPIYFHENIRVEIQDMGGTSKQDMLSVIEQGGAFDIVSLAYSDGTMEPLYKTGFQFTADAPEGWYNFYRMDDFSSTAYFYYNAPASTLPPLCPVAERL